MKWVTLQMKPRMSAPMLGESEIAEFCAALSFRECATIDEIVAVELRRRGFWRVPFGSRIYRAVEAIVCADIQKRELDLWEIAASIEEAKWEQNMS